METTLRARGGSEEGGNRREPGRGVALNRSSPLSMRSTRGQVARSASRPSPGLPPDDPPGLCPPHRSVFTSRGGAGRLSKSCGRDAGDHRVQSSQSTRAAHLEAIRGVGLRRSAALAHGAATCHHQGPCRGVGSPSCTAPSKEFLDAFGLATLTGPADRLGVANRAHEHPAHSRRLVSHFSPPPAIFAGCADDKPR
jgi:hypothetical protein